MVLRSCERPVTMQSPADRGEPEREALVFAVVSAPPSDWSGWGDPPRRSLAGDGEGPEVLHNDVGDFS